MRVKRQARTVAYTGLELKALNSWQNMARDGKEVGIGDSWYVVRHV